MFSHILLLIVVHFSYSYDTCMTDDFCPPQPISVVNPLQFDDSLSTFIDRDNISGCYCRLYTESMACFGRENCISVPQKWPCPRPTMAFRTTNLTVIHKKELDIFFNVTTLYILENINLHTIEPGVFLKMRNLTLLSISFNVNLKFLEVGTFEGLLNLDQLYLTANGFTKVLDSTRGLGVGILPQLTVLHLKENNFEAIQEEDFGPMFGSQLLELNLVLCRIQFIHPKAFLPLKKLNFLKCGLNSFNETVITKVMDVTVKAGIPLTHLSMYSCGFIRKPPRLLMEIIANSSITYLNLSQNRFEIIDNDSFPLMPKLKLLDLSEVLAFNITNNAFANLPNLRTLILRGNKLKQISDGILLPNITYLDLQQNSGSLFFSPYFSIIRNKFRKMGKLQELDLSYNVLDALFEDTFTGLDNIRLLGLKNATIRSVKNHSFGMMHKLELLNLENNYFVKNNPTGLEDCLFCGLRSLKVLLLGWNYIKFLSQCSNPFRELTSLVHLDLRGNYIQQLASSDFQHLLKIQRLDLSSNLIIPWTENIFQNNTDLQYVDLSNNKLSFLTDIVILDLTNIKDVNLHDNAFVCDCDAFDSFTRSNINQSKLFCEFPALYKNWTVAEFIASAPTCDPFPVTTKLSVILPSLLLVLTIVTFLFFLYYYRHHVSYWMFLTRLYLSKKGKIPTKCTKNCQIIYKYDAFVSYSTEDRNFVLRLVTMLENHEPYLKLCVYERDFEIGTFISDSVLQNVANSRKTVLIISDNYAKSQWCRWESQIAHHHRLFFENDHGEVTDDTLILIKIGPVSAYHLTPTLKYLLKTRIYLQWDYDENKEKDFWDKLRHSLRPHHKITHM